jgi:hypothetical protein
MRGRQKGGGVVSPERVLDTKLERDFLNARKVY